MMAERSQRKFADNSDFHPNDPFAELTRIMGFDPRVADMAPSAAPSRPAEDDLDIDLERELLGEFGGPAGDPEPLDSAAPSVPGPYALQPLEGNAGKIAVSGTVADTAAVDAVAEPDVEAETAAGQQAARPSDAADDLLLLDDDFAASIEAEIVSEPAAHQVEIHPQAAPREASAAVEPAETDAVAASDAADDWTTADLAADDGLRAEGRVSDDDMAFIDMDFGTGIEARQPDPSPGAASDQPVSLPGEALEASSHAESMLEDELAALLSEDPQPASAPEAIAVGHVDAAPTLAGDDVDTELQGEADEEVVSVAGPETEGEPFGGVASAPEEEGEALAAIDDAEHAPHASADDESQMGEAVGSDSEEANDPFAELEAIAARAFAVAPAAVAAAPVAAASETPIARPRFSIVTPTLPPRAEVPVAAAAAPALNETDGSAWVQPGSAEPEIAQEVSAPQDQDSAASAIYDDAALAEIPGDLTPAADDLDLPQPSYVHAQPATPVFDDLDLDLVEETAVDFGGRGAGQGEPARFSDDLDAAIEEFVADIDGDFDAVAAEPAGRRLHEAEAYDAYGADFPAGASGGDAQLLAGETLGASAAGMDGPQDDFDDYEAEYEETEKPRNKTLWVAGLLAGVAVLGGVGAWAISFGGDQPTTTIVRADPEPVKIKPENPGGSVVPNQDNPVYDRVAGAAAPALPEPQEKLISGIEEPVDLDAATAPAAAAEPADLPALDGDAAPGANGTAAPAGDVADALPGVDINTQPFPAAEPEAAAKNEDRIIPAEADDGSDEAERILAIAPRRVKTMIVRPDGTMVPREEEPAAPETAMIEAGSEATSLEATLSPAETASAEAAPVQQAEAVSASPAEASPAGQSPAVAAAAPVAGQAKTVVASAADAAVATGRDVTPAAQDAAVTTGSNPVTPATVPIAPSRPGDQPVDIVGEVRNQPAAAQPQPVALQPDAVQGGGWTMQIASQPTPEGAQTAYANLSQRYSSILSGKGVNIVKADIAGKGTFYRVRIPAGSRNEAIQMCESLKAAGGSCFVSR